jgi:hypothetical protein
VRPGAAADAGGDAKTGRTVSTATNAFIELLGAYDQDLHALELN